MDQNRHPTIPEDGTVNNNLSSRGSTILGLMRNSRMKTPFGARGPDQHLKIAVKLNKDPHIKSAMTSLMCLVYCMITCVFGIAFPVSDALASRDGHHTYYTEIFHCLEYVISLSILIYFFVLVKRYSSPGKTFMRKVELDPTAYLSRRQRESLAGVDNPIFENRLDRLPRPDTEEKLQEVDQCYIASQDEGVNFYLRLGAVIFGLGAMTLAGFRIAEPFENKIMIKCRTKIFILNSCLYLLLVLLQTFFVFKYHRIIFNIHKPLVRLCLVHLVATNLSIWLSTTTHETAEDIGRAVARERFAKLNGTPSHGSVASEQSTHADAGCHDLHTLTDKTAPFLFPCLIEYSLIAAAIFYHVFLNVGKVIVYKPVYERPNPKDNHDDLNHGHECQKSNIGLFAGLLIVLMTIVSLAMFFVFKSTRTDNTAIIIFIGSDMFILVIMLIASSAAIFFTRKLDFGHMDDDKFDNKLLIIAQFGVYLLGTFIAVSSANSFIKHYDPISGSFLLLSILNFIQSTVQTIFILDGLRRRATRPEHVRTKPGRSLVTFLMVCNIAMWMVNTFEIKKVQDTTIHIKFYNYVPWSIIVHLCIPLIIFYRYHSSACLAEIWNRAYRRRKWSILEIPRDLESGQ